MLQYIVVFVTTDSLSSAAKIGKILTRKRLVACANIIPGVKSVFRWEGKIQKSDEILLILKSKKNLFDRIVQEVRRLHPYQVPEIIALPIVSGNQSYLEWIEKEVEE